MNVRTIARGALLALATTVSVSAGAQSAPVIAKVEPPDWWVGHSVNPVRVLVRGTGLAGARFECGRLRCAAATVNAAGTSAFVNVTIPAGTRTGPHPIVLRTVGGRTSFDFRVHPKRPARDGFAGFDQSDVLYLIMPDRFANGDPSNDDPARSAGIFDRAKARSYHGGDLAGVRARLPYLKSLGVTAIWLNPIYDNDDRTNGKEVIEGQAATAYHGYHARDYYAVDEHLGDTATFRALVEEAHRLGIKVILDMVANHTGPGHPWVADPPTPTWFNGTKASHLANPFQAWTLADPYAPEAARRPTLDGWFVDLLPDLNQGDAEVSRYLVQNTLWWVETFALDGIRQDTWPYVPRSFWREWMAAIKRARPTVRVVGEVFEGDPTLVAFFEGARAPFDGLRTGVDYLFDFPTHFAMRGAFARGGSVRELAQMVARDRVYADARNLVTFLGLHDVGRFMGETGATVAGMKLAYTWQLTTRGIPLIYYGDEIAMPGGGDPDNRRDFPGGWRGDARDAFVTAGRTPEEQDLWAHVQRLIALRKERPELRSAPLEHLVTDDQQYAYRRGRTVVVLNNATKEATVRVPVTALGAALLGGCGTPRAEGGTVVVTVPARTGCIF
jgi:glycosidase